MTLAWNRNSEANIAGYRLYYGTASRVYANVINVGNLTTATVSSLSPGVTYRFAVTALNTLGLESGYSSEIAFTTTNLVTPNIPPTLAALSNLTINEDAGAQTVLLTGISSGGEIQTLTVSASATPQSLISSVDTVYASPGATGTLSFQTAPNMSGSGTITVTVSDGLAQTARSFTVAVNPVNDGPTIGNIADRTINQNTATGPVGFIVGDVDTAASSLSLTANSSNPSLVPIENIVFGGSGTSRTVNVTPVADQTGTATISVTVSDGSWTATDSWLLTVDSAPTNTPPALSAVRSTTVFSGGSSLPLRFSVSDAETPAEGLQLRAVSSNPTLVPANNISYQGSGSDGKLTVAANSGVGNATITISVDDGSGNTRSTNFGVNVISRPAQLVYIPLEAEEGAIVAPMQLYSDSSATYVTTTTRDQGTVSLPFSITEPGNYIIWARHLSPNNAQDSFYVSVDGVEIPYPTAIFTWSPDWQWTRVTIPDNASTQDPRVLNLSAGTHTVTFRGSEAYCALDRIIICNDLEFVPGAASNTAPNISSFNARTIAANTSTGPIAFTVSDAETPGSLLITATSSNPSLVPTANMTIGGTGTDRTLTVTPALNQSGTATISVRVSDGQLSTTSSFLLTVTPTVTTNVPPTLDSIASIFIGEDSAPFVLSLAGISAGAGENQPLTVSVSATPSSLIPPPQVTYTSPSATGTISFAPATNMSGSGTITVTVSDGMAATTRTFSVMVAPVNDAPGLTSLGSRRINKDATTGPIGFTIGDPETPAANLALSGTSSNPTLVPQGNITFGGSSSNRTVQVTPATGQSGTATITVWVSDGTLAANRTFELTVTDTNAWPTMAPLPNASVPVRFVSELSPIVIGDIDSTNLLVTASSSDTGVLPNGNILIGSSGLSRTLSVRPQRAGTTTVTLSVSDGFAQSSQSFLLTATNRFKLRPSELSTSSSGAFTVVWDSSPGDTYRVMAKTDLSSTNWVAISGNLTAVSETTWWTDHAAGFRHVCFYLIELVASE